MKRAILLIAVLVGLAVFAAPRAEAHPFIGVSIGGPGYYYGPGFYPYAYEPCYYGYPGYYESYYYGRPYYRHAYYGYGGGYYGRRYYGRSYGHGGSYGRSYHGGGYRTSSRGYSSHSGHRR